MLKTYAVELIESRNILKSLIIKNLVGSYKNSVLGFTWHFVTPILMMMVYYVVFTQIRSNPIPDFWIYLISGLFPFTFMTSNLTTGTGCIVNNSSMIKKMYFPREIIVLSHVLSSFIVMLMGYIASMIIIAATGFNLSAIFALAPIFLLMMFIFVLGYTFLLSSLSVYIRDIQYFFNTITIVFYFITPIYFLTDSVSGLLETIVWLNPFTYFIEAFHQIIYFNQLPSFTLVLLMCIITLTSITTGWIVFHKLKKGFAERL